MISGILNIYKEPGFTSHDVVAKLRGIIGQKKIGHTGTLDPDAEGVLPVCLGSATKVCDLLTDERKTYEADLLLGVSTDTQDASGAVVARREVQVTEEDLREVLAGFLGEQMQIPPMYSAIKKDGRKLYELARQGVEVPRDPRPVCFYEIELLRFASPRAKLRVTCSKGTYIRTLCHDIGERLSCGGCMEHLVRTRVGRFSIDEAVRLERVQTAMEEKTLGGLLLPADALFEDLPAVALSRAQDPLAHNGNRLRLSSDAGRVRVYDSAGRFVGLYVRAGETYQVEKMFLVQTDEGAGQATGRCK